MTPLTCTTPLSRSSRLISSSDADAGRGRSHLSEEEGILPALDSITSALNAFAAHERQEYLEVTCVTLPTVVRRVPPIQFSLHVRYRRHEDRLGRFVSVGLSCTAPIVHRTAIAHRV
jgi:hypothetical protein